MKVPWHVGCALVLAGLVVPPAFASASRATGSADDRTAVHTTRGVVKSVDSKAIVRALPSPTATLSLPPGNGT